MGRGRTGIRNTRPANSTRSAGTLSSFWMEQLPEGSLYDSYASASSISSYIQELELAWNNPGQASLVTVEKVEKAKELGLTLDEMIAIHSYSGAGYEALNSPGYFLSTPEATAWRNKWRKKLISGMEKLPDWKGTAIRRTGRSQIPLENTLAEYQGYMENSQIIQYDRFNSYSKTGKFGAGSPIEYITDSLTAKDISGIARHSNEDEVLFLPSARYIVADVKVKEYKMSGLETTDKPLKIQIYLEEVDPNDPAYSGSYY